MKIHADMYNFLGPDIPLETVSTSKSGICIGRLRVINVKPHYTPPEIHKGKVGISQIVKSPLCPCVLQNVNPPTPLGTTHRQMPLSSLFYAMGLNCACQHPTPGAVGWHQIFPRCPCIPQVGYSGAYIDR